NLLTRKIFYSDNVYRLYGLKPASLPVSLNIFLNYVHTDDRELVSEATRKILQEHAPPDIEYRIQRQDGKLRYIRQRGKLMLYADSEMVMLVTLQDITAETISKQKHTELKEFLSIQQFAYQQAEEMAGIGSWFWDLEGDKAIWSDSMYGLLGLKPTVMPLTLAVFKRYVYPDDHKLFSDHISQLQYDKKESRFQFRLLISGGVKYISASFKSMNHEGRELFFGTLQDVSQNNLLQQQLTQRVQLAESLSENIQDAVLITDEHNNIIFWNKRCDETYGLKKEQALHRNFFDVLPHFKEDSTIKHFQQVFKGIPVVEQAVSLPGIIGYHDLFMTPLKNEGGIVTGILHIRQDVTLQQTMQLHLTERLNFIEGLVEASIDRIIVIDRHMNYLYCNQRAADFYGMKKEDIVGKNILEVFPNAINDPTYEHFRTVFKGETVILPAIEGMSDEHYYQVFLIPLKDASEVVSAVLWMHHDLSGEIKLQRQLKKADELLNSINEAYIELDHDGVFYYINNKAEEILNTPKEQMLEKNIWEVFPEYVDSESYKIINSVLTEKQTKGGEYYSAQTGQWMYMSAMPTTEGAIVLFYDISEIKEAKQKLEVEHIRLKEAQEMGHIGSFDLAIGDAVMLWSDELYRIYDLEPQSESIKVQKLDSFVHPDEVDNLRKLKEQALSKPGLYQIMHRIITRKGVLKYVNHRFESIANKEGTIVRIHGTLQDITELVQTEQKLKELNNSLDKRNKELEEKNDELAAFAFIASHDLKEPLRKIHIFSNLISENEEPNLTLTGKDYLHRMRQAVKRMELLIDDILTLSRLHTKDEIFEDIALEDVINNSKAEFDTIIAESGAKITLSHLPVVKGIETQLFHLFNNLIGNALKFQKKGVAPQITIKATEVKGSEIDTTWSDSKTYIRIAVTDNGIGFEQEQSKKIFQIFQRLHGISEYPGTGIGLAICKKIMDNHNGFIEAESTLGKGASFYCYFPKNH
ncbi:MAG TPA: PAS domain S-box protein, partial [Chitinophagaceae bacterium]|nr:PAS domain S-box protein [Chitinophagaceae bacterium]